ncbi:hypothetical protein Avbf_06706 [Armadillidium vulgare]|nr:hypothetical protein Avbf_06706 [Armadillidium vulgare]
MFPIYANLLDLKLASPLQTSTFEVQNRDPCHLIFSPNPLIPPTTTVTLDSNSQIVKNYPMFASPYDMDSPTKLQRANFSLYSKNSNCTDYLYNNQKPCNAEVSNYSPGNYKEYHDFLRSGYSEPATRTAPVKGSQDLYNPTYEEISSGSETTSVSSESSSRKKSIPSPQTLASPTKKIPGSWSPTPCPCVVKNNSSLRKGSRNRCNKYNSHNVCGSSYLADEYSDESSTHLYAAVPAPIPPPSLYTYPWDE